MMYKKKYLHSIIFILKLHLLKFLSFWLKHLHSIIFILKRTNFPSVYESVKKFTFYNIYIKTMKII